MTSVHGITSDHSDYLEAHAVDVELAASLGVYSASEPNDLPEDQQGGIGRYLPGLVFGWTGPDGRQAIQLRPDTAPTNSDGEAMKYVYPKGIAPVLWAVREAPGSEKVLLVEGSKQCLVAASLAPEGWSVYGIAGCWGWSHDGNPIPDLEIVDGAEVVIVFDADLASNHDVWTAAKRLASALEIEGADSVRWVHLPAGRKSGLDDVLASRSADRRGSYLARLIGKAEKKLPKEPPKKQKKTVEPDGQRPVVDVESDRLSVVTELTDALISKFDGADLFNHGGVISKFAGRAMHPVDKGSFNNLVIHAAMPVQKTRDGFVHTWPDANSMQAVLASADKFTPLDRVVEVPFVRPDGTVVAEAGYDEATRTLLVLPDGLDVEVPDFPSGEDLRAARELILGEWLGDMPFPDDAARANALAMILTPFIRGLVPLVPLAVVDGLQMGVGKNLLADCMAIVATGRVADPKPHNVNDEEHRKVILSAFRAGDSLMVFDEAHTIEGASFARAITAVTYSDRVLGVSNMAEFPNRVTWMALGNQVRVSGDMTRRVYRVRLAPGYANPQDRAADTFRHPELREWTAQNRGRLVSAALTLIRAWYAAGSPSPATTSSFGSFEGWERITRGVLENSGVSGFLADLKDWRSESDFFTQYRVAHLAWLAEQFGTSTFRTADAVDKAVAAGKEYPAPDDLDDPAEKTYSKKLGQLYNRIEGRAYDGLSIVKAGRVGGGAKVVKWAIVNEGEEPEHQGEEPDQGGGTDPSDGSGWGVLGGSEGDPPPHARGKTNVSARDAPRAREAGVPLPSEPPRTPQGSELTFDLETGDANALNSYGPGFVRLAGMKTGEDSVITTEFGEVTEAIRAAGRVTGHNIMAFDLPALARHHDLDLAEVHVLAAQGRLNDTMLVARHLDPPMAREKGVEARGRYGLDKLGETYNLGRKSGDLKALAKEYGGFDQIPTDDDRYRTYLAGDLELNADLAEHQDAQLDDADRRYLVREHRVAALAAQITHNGFRVDTDLLNERIGEIQDKKVKALDRLADVAGVPLTDPKGRPYSAPLATKAGKNALIEAFESAGVKQLWKTEKSGDLATSREAMDGLIEEHRQNRRVVEIAKLVKTVVTSRTIYQTISDNLVGDRVHPRVSMRQSTGRWSLTDPGLTVIGKHGELFHEREVFLPDPGEVIVAVDLSQVDMRAVAGLSQDQAYIDMLRAEDPHAEIAETVLGDRNRRYEAKPIGHGWNYSRGIKAIAEDNNLDPRVVRQFDEMMRRRFPVLVQWQEQVRETAQSGEFLDNGFGRPMRPDPSRAFTQGPALMGQGAARDIMMEGLLRLAERHPEVMPMLRAQVHDEIVLSVPLDIAEDVTQSVKDALTFEWQGVPIIAEAESPGSSWGAVYAH